MTFYKRILSFYIASIYVLYVNRYYLLFWKIHDSRSYEIINEFCYRIPFVLKYNIYIDCFIQHTSFPKVKSISIIWKAAFEEIVQVVSCCSLNIITSKVRQKKNQPGAKGHSAILFFIFRVLNLKLPNLTGGGTKYLKFGWDIISLNEAFHVIAIELHFSEARLIVQLYFKPRSQKYINRCLEMAILWSRRSLLFIYSSS